MAARKPFRVDTFTAEYLRSILSYDPLTGIFTWKTRPDLSPRWNTRYAGTHAGYLLRGHRVIQVKGRVGYRAARLAWLYMTGEWPPEQVDHKDLDRSNERWDNLRLATNTQNNQNKKSAQRNNHTSGIRGVSPHQGKWRARIWAHGKQHEIGVFASIEEAAKARYAAEAKYYGEFAPQR